MDGQTGQDSDATNGPYTTAEIKLRLVELSAGAACGNNSKVQHLFSTFNHFQFHP